LQLIIAPIKVHPDARLQGRSVTSCHMPAPSLFVSHRVTPPGEYTSQIEGPAVDKSGNLYVVNFHSAGTIGKVAPGASHSTLFATLHHGRIGSGIRFDRQGRMYIADFKKNNVLVIAPGRTDAQVYFHSDDFNQPNDLAIAADGTLYASDPDFPAHTGQIWKITRNADGTAHGEVMQAPRQLRQTNGLDLSPDGTTLYVDESDTRQIWAYRLEGNKLVDPRLATTFDEFELDGLRTDVTGRIFVARPGAGDVAIVNPDGTLVRKVTTLGKEPTNLAFGGSDGKTVFVTQKDGKFIEAFLTDQPGREFAA
jgi:sugar lactone lactonase YvrE